MELVEEIENLAEKVLKKYSTCLPVEPLEIAKKLTLKVLFEPYENYFRGNILLLGREFYILLNSEILKDINYTGARYTLAHELGHYFIKTHRDRIKKGEPLAFSGKEVNSENKKIIEREAEQFAASLLMPRIKVINYFKNTKSRGFELVIGIKSFFNVSMTSAAIRYNRLNLTPSITVSWSLKGIIGKGVSEKFLELLNNDYSLQIKINPDRPKYDEEEIINKESGIKYYRSITPLSSWVYDVPKGISNEIFLIEETLYYKHGNLTVLRPL